MDWGGSGRPIDYGGSLKINNSKSPQGFAFPNLGDWLRRQYQDNWLLEFGLRLFNNKSGSDKLMGPSAKSFYVEFNLPWEDNKIIEII